MPFTTPSETSRSESPPSGAVPPDPTRTGAIWVTGTGAFLLIAAAVALVATHWSTLSDQVKFAILALVTAGCLLAGRRLRPLLPATAGVLFHLGALLLPINVAALLLDTGVTWPTQLVVQGATAAAAFTLLAALEDSIVLRVGAGIGVVVLAAGLGATFEISPALVLVGFAVLASLAGADRVAVAWATVAGLAPLVALTERFASMPTPVIHELGMVGRPSRSVAAAVGGAAALVIGRAAGARHSIPLAAVATVVAAVGAATTWVELDPSAGMSWAGAAAVFLLLELAALVLAADPFWWRPARALATSAEVVAGIVVAVATGWALVAAGADAGRSVDRVLDLPVVLAAGLAALAWLAADLRRRAADGTPMGIALLVGSGWWPGSLGLTVSVAAGALLGAPSFAASGIVLAALAAFFVLAGRPLGHGLAVVLATVAPALAGGNTALVAALAAAGAATIGWATIVRAGLLTATSVEESLALSGCSVLPIVTGAAVTSVSAPASSVIAAAATLAWLTGVLVDRAADRGADPWIGWLPRGAAIASLWFGWALSPTELAALSAALTMAVIVDSLRRDQALLMAATSVTLPVAAGATVRALDGSWATVGVVWCAIALLACGADLVVAPRWRVATLAVVTTLAVGGLVLASTDPGAMGLALLLLGSAASAEALARRHLDLALVGAVIATAGVWLVLSDRHVPAVDAYAAPVAAVLLAAGLCARLRPLTDPDGVIDDPGPPSSWIAYAPAILVLGGAAIVDRATGGGSVHALVAGATGVVAVTVGGARRMAGPLFVGTALVVAATALESVHAAAGVPTTVWLAAGGTLLVGAGIAMERHDTGPVETGRRLVDVIHERFS